MLILLILLIYLIGCVLSFGRVVGSFFEIEESYPEFRLRPIDFFQGLMTIASWLGFITGICVYFALREKYFFKWSKKPLWEKYHENKFEI